MQLHANAYTVVPGTGAVEQGCKLEDISMQEQFTLARVLFVVHSGELQT